MSGRVYSAMRPSGRLHIGNYFGALQNWVSLQDEYDCIYSVADIHALTTVQGADTAEILPNTREMVLDWLAAGLDPTKSILFVQSHVPQVLTLYALLSMSTPLGWLMRVPTFKDRVRQMNESEETVPYGLVGYPVLQTADVILYKADTVPVGIDQVPHIELSREIVRRFNNLYGETFPEPQAKLTSSPSILGTDGGNKMSKSMDNQIELASSEDETTAKIRTMVTDPQRARRTDPGRPWMCNVYSLHKLFSADRTQEIHDQCTSAKIGCVDDKKILADNINSFFSEFRERRSELSKRPGYVDDILSEGAVRARNIADETIREVYHRMGLS
jgi:tryptophanyl-tRNA synthetase